MESGGPRLKCARTGLKRADVRNGESARGCTRGAGSAAGVGVSAVIGAMDCARYPGKYGQCAGAATMGVAPEDASIGAICPAMAQ